MNSELFVYVDTSFMYKLSTLIEDQTAQSNLQEALDYFERISTS
jgi:hypothetical protein